MSEADIKSDAVLKETECAEEGAQQVRLTEGASDNSPELQVVASGSTAQRAQPSLPVHVAMPVWKFYLLRFLGAILDSVLVAVTTFLVVVGTVAFLSVMRLMQGLESFSALYFLFILVSLIVVLKMCRSYFGYTETSMRVVDRSGARISVLRSLARAVAFGVTWFLLPINLVFMAAGSRQLLHDMLSGCHVVGPGENPTTSFYPPTPKWLAALLVIGCVGFVFRSDQVREQWDRLESQFVPVLLGQDTPLYLTYLESGCKLSAKEIAGLRQKEAIRLLDRFELLVAQRGPLSPSSSSHEIELVYKTALVAARANNPVVAAHYLEILGHLPGIRIEQALGVRWIDVLEFETSPRLRAANLLRKVGHKVEAIELAKGERNSAKKSGDKDRLAESIKMIDLIQRQDPFDGFFDFDDPYDDTAKARRAVMMQLRQLEDASK